MPSPAASLCAAVAEVTGHTVDYIWRRMPLAQARQYEQLFYAKHQIKCRALGRGGDTLHKIIE